MDLGAVTVTMAARRTGLAHDGRTMAGVAQVRNVPVLGGRVDLSRFAGQKASLPAAGPITVVATGRF